MAVETISKVKRPVKSILISQPKPETKSPYLTLAEKWGIKVDFRSFIRIDEVSGKEVRKAKINPADYSAIIFNSRNGIDHFFRVCEELRIKMSGDTKYFCTSEAIALYLQKYIQYRKRKVFFGKGGGDAGLTEVLKKHKNNEKFLFPCSDIRKDIIPDYMNGNGFDWEEVVMYQTVPADLSDLEDVFYDMIVFFSPMGVESLYKNFPDFKQNKTRIAAFGPTTRKAIEAHGLTVNVAAPQLPEIRSMTMAIDLYLKEANK